MPLDFHRLNPKCFVSWHKKLEMLVVTVNMTRIGRKNVIDMRKKMVGSTEQ